MRKRSVVSAGVRSATRGTTRRGETRTWPGRIGLRFTRANVRGVWRKTCGGCCVSQKCQFGLGMPGLRKGRYNCGDGG